LNENEVLDGEGTELAKVDLFRGNHLYIITCDIIDPQIWGKRCLPVLKVFPQTRTESAIANNSFHPIQYCPLAAPTSSQYAFVSQTKVKKRLTSIGGKASLAFSIFD
jgi:hypothetical protein